MIRSRFTYANVMSTLAVVLVLAGGTAWAASLTKNSVFSRHIANGEVKRPDMAASAVNSGKVANGSLLQADLATGVLPSARVIGFEHASCNLDTSAPGETQEGYQPCVSGELVLAQPARVHVLATGNWFGSGGGTAVGKCRLVVDTNPGPDVSMGEIGDTTGPASEHAFVLQDVTGKLAKGAHTFTLQCQEQLGDMDWTNVVVTATTLTG